MGALVSKCKTALQADDAFSYQTVKFVVIKDKRLGIIHYVLQFFIFVYIVIYTILYQQRYLLLESPYGSVRATLQEPKTLPEANTLSYCNQSGNSIINGFGTHECAYFMGSDLTYPALMDSIMISTRVKDTFYNNPNTSSGCSHPPTSPSCMPVRSSLQNRYFTAGIENYTVFMEHAVFGRQNKLVLSSTSCEGKLIYRDERKKPVLFNDVERIGDIVPLSTLLDAAEIPSLDVASGVGDSYRYDGVMVMVVITYTNYITKPESLHYTYELFTIPNQDVLVIQPSEATAEGAKQRTWYGVRFVFMIVGSIGYFDFPTLLTSLVSGTVLLSLSTTVVDMLILHIMPDKKAYSKHKFETTDTFGKKRRGLEREGGSTNTIPLLSNDYAAMS